MSDINETGTFLNKLDNQKGLNGKDTFHQALQHILNCTKELKKDQEMLKVFIAKVQGALVISALVLTIFISMGVFVYNQLRDEVDARVRVNDFLAHIDQARETRSLINDNLSNRIDNINKQQEVINNKLDNIIERYNRVDRTSRDPRDFR